jgi:hypothetical protein
LNITGRQPLFKAPVSLSGILIIVVLLNLRTQRRMSPCGMWHRVGIMKTDASGERVASIFRVEGIGEKTSRVGWQTKPLDNTTRHATLKSRFSQSLPHPHIPENRKVHSYRRENLKSRIRTQCLHLVCENFHSFIHFLRR